MRRYLALLIPCLILMALTAPLSLSAQSTATPTFSTATLPGTPTPLPTLSEDEDRGSRQAPIPLGQAKVLMMGKTKEFEIGIWYIVRGAEAWDRIRQASIFNSPPDEGKEYLLAYVLLYYRTGPSDDPLTLGAYDFAVFSGGQLDAELKLIIEPEPRFSFRGLPPAFSSGWVARLVDADDPFPMLVLGADKSGKGGFYFATSSLMPTATPTLTSEPTLAFTRTSTRRPVTSGPTRTPGPTRTWTSTRPPATLKPASTLPPPPAGIACPGIRLTCTQLKTCAEAYACLKAGNTRLDADKDGIPCESLCQ